MRLSESSRYRSGVLTGLAVAAAIVLPGCSDQPTHKQQKPDTGMAEALRNPSKVGDDRYKVTELGDGCKSIELREQNGNVKVAPVIICTDNVEP